MFQFRRFPAYTYLIQCTLLEYCSSGFPHSEISGSMRMCRSPKLIAACHVLRRLLMPRHSPCALYSLIYYHSCFSNYAGIHFGSFRNCNCFTLLKKFHNYKSFRFASLLPCNIFSLFSFQGTKLRGVPSKLNIVRTRLAKRSDLGSYAGVVTGEVSIERR